MQVSSIRRTRLLSLTTAARFLLGGALLAGALLLLPRFTVPDLAQDYAAAWGWWHGYDPNGQTEQLLRACCTDPALARNYPNMQTAHPPFATLLTLPFALLPYEAARILWCVVAWACILWGWRQGKVSVATCAATASFWLIALVLGTLEPLIFALLTTAIVLIDRAPVRAGILVGVCVALKAYPALVLISLWFSGRHRIALTATATAIAAMLIAEGVLGIGATMNWLRWMPINTARYVDTLENISLVRLVREFVPGASPTVVAALLVLALLLPLVRFIRSSDGIRPLIPVMLLASPLSWRHYIGMVGINAPGRIEQVCLTIAGVVVLLIGLHVLPGDALAPITQIPLLITLLLLWYRMVRSGLRAARRRKALSIARPARS